MKKIDINNWNRKRTYDVFKSFSNSTYNANVNIDVTNLVKRTKGKDESFFIDLLYIVVKGLNSIPEMRMRLVNGEPYLFETINPAFTVLTKDNNFENVRHKNYDEYKKFYNECSNKIKEAEKEDKLSNDDYNPKDCFDEYYITCLPWIKFTEFNHPIPDDKASQCVPRICWSKYEKNGERYELNLNITVSHMFVDGYPLSKAFLTIQELLNNVDNELK